MNNRMSNFGSLNEDEILELLEQTLTDIATEFPADDRTKFQDGIVHGIVMCITVIKANMED